MGYIKKKTLPEQDVLYHICPSCGVPSSIDQHCCRCGYRLSPALPVYRLCPECNRFILEETPRCECGYSFPAEEHLFHVCPACGVMTPQEQRTCDCGYRFNSECVSRHEKDEASDKTKVPMWGRIVIAGLAVSLLAVSTILPIGWYHTHQQLLVSQTDLADAETTNTQLQARNEGLQARSKALSELNEKNSIELTFWRDYAVIVDDAGIYHSYGCTELTDMDGFWIFDIDTAKYVDFEPCDNCRRSGGKLIRID